MYAFDLTVLQVTIDIVLCNAFTNLCLGIFRETPKLARSLQTELFLQFDDIFALAAPDQTAITP